MVATICVVKGGVVGTANYFNLMDEGVPTRYYTTEHTGIWRGSAAAELGLRDHVTKSPFEFVLAGYSPAGDRLIKRLKKRLPKLDNSPKAKAKKSLKIPKRRKRENVDTVKQRERNLGFDVTFSVPKSVSILWAIGPRWVRRMIKRALQNASDKTLRDLESLVPLARRGMGGKELMFAKLVVASFMHTVNRDNEPQLHIHNVIANMCLGADGRWSGVNSQLLHRWTPALGRIFRCHLARELVQTLGLELIRPVKNGVARSWFEVKGIPRQLIRFFSSRRQSIEAAVAPGEMGDSKKRQEAALQTRAQKVKPPELEVLQEQWRNEAEKHGISSATIESLCHKEVPERPIADLEKVLSDAVKELGRKKSHFHEAEVVAAVCEHYQHFGVDPTDLVKRVQKEIRENPQSVVLSESPSNSRLTSKENWEIERKLLKDSDTLMQNQGAVVKPRMIRKVLRNHAQLDQEQQQAVEQLCAQKGGIRVLSGVAGAGKSTTLDAVREAFERSGYQVLGTAIAGKAARELGDKTGIETRTVASYLYHQEKSKVAKLADRVKHDVRMLIRELRSKKTWKYERVEIAKKSVLIIDEAGMLDTRTLARLLHHCKEKDATVILTGDTKQLPPILAGGPMDHLATKTGQASLTTNRRQKSEPDRKAVQMLREGEVAEALKDYAARGRLTVESDFRSVSQRIKTTWKEHGGCRKPAENLILTQTKAEARELNKLCQSERMRTGRLVPGLSIKHGEYRFYVGDRVAFHEPLRKHGIENGHAATVIGINPLTREMTVRLEHEPSKRQAEMGIGRVQKIPLLVLNRDAMSLGYAGTTHRAQGQTAENAFVLLSGSMLSREMTYTQLTRAKSNTLLFVDERTAGEELEDLIKSVSRSASKDLAHDHLSSKDRPRESLDQASSREAELRIYLEHDRGLQ